MVGSPGSVYLPTSRLASRDRVTLRTQLLLALGCMASLPVVLLGVVQAQSAAAAAADLADRETLLASTSLAREVGYLIEAQASVTRTFAGEVGASGRLDGDVRGWRAEQYLNTFPGLYGAMILDRDGRTTGGAVVEPGSAPKAAIGLFYGDRTWVKDVENGAAFSAELVRSRLSGRPAISFAAPVVDRTGKRLGLVALGIDLDPVQRALERVTEAAPGLATVILDSSGRVVAAAGSERLAPLENLAHVSLYETPGSAVARRLGKSETGELRRGTAVLVQTGVVHWWVTTTWPQAAVRQRALKALLTMFGFALGALGLGLGAAIFLARAIAQPVTRLSNLLASIGSGDLRVRTERAKGWYPRELVALISAIDGMLGQLHPLVAQLRRAVVAIAEVTVRLQQASARMVGDSHDQHQAVHRSSGAIVQIGDSISSVGNGVQSLSKTASEAIQSILSIDRQIDRIAGNLHTLGETIDGAAMEGSHMDQQVGAVAQSALQLSQNVERTSGSLKLLTESIQHVVTSAEQGEALAHDALAAAKAGRGAVDETIESIREIQARFGAVGEAVLRLARRSEAIGNVVLVIDEVTRATRVLAINASIISSDAGELGTGFSVVADRVRAMASETAASTSQITSLIASVQSDIRQAVKAVESGQETVRTGERRSTEAGSRLRAIIESTGEAGKTAQEIARASRDQAMRVDMVAAAVTAVQHATDRISSAADAQRQAQERVGLAIAKVRSVGDDVRTSTQAQQRDSRSMTAAVRAMTSRLQSIAESSEAQGLQRNRIQGALGIFEGAAQGSVEHARQLGAVMHTLSDRLDQLQKHLGAFRVE
jgi:methyl-accepting chemotaxis protein